MADVASVEASGRSKTKPRWHVLVGDFANMLKAFIGANYLTIAYAFKQSGLWPGVTCLLFVAALTDYCCHLIVKCKYHAIDRIQERKRRLSRLNNPVHSGYGSNDSDSESDANGDRQLSESEDDLDYKRMQKSFTYGDIGKVAFGKAGLFIVNFCLVFTQFGFCVSYFIFVGNTIHSFFPNANNSIAFVPVTNATPANTTLAPITTVPTTTLNTTLIPDTTTTTTLNTTFNSTTASLHEIYDYFLNLPEEEPTEAQNTSWSNLYPSAVSTGPNLSLLVLSPLPIFLAFALLRDVRHLGLVSVGADIAIFIGCVVTLLYITVGYEQSRDWELADFGRLAVFFGMVTSAFEGIGTIIPIESSMEGNRHNYSKFLHGAIFILTSLLTVFGVVGYLRYGSETAQMLNKNIPPMSFTGLTLNILLCVGVILTFPLQIFPVIEILEIYIFGYGRCLGPKKYAYQSLNDSDQSSDAAEAALLPKEAVEEDSAAPVAAVVPPQVQTWKRNVLRMLVVLTAAGLAILLRDYFAYVGALTGSIGSSLLAFILPCAFHMKLQWQEAGLFLKLKDGVIIVFGIIASIISLYVTVHEIIERYTDA